MKHYQKEWKMTEQTTNALDVMPKRTDLDADLNTMVQTAHLMSKASVSLPKHLHNNPAECMAILMQSRDWKMNPYAVGQKTSIINGKLMYEGQLVNAVINSSGALAKRLEFKHKGTGQSMEVEVTGLLKGEVEPRSIIVKMPPTDKQNSPQWKTDPEQQICYLAARKWVRRFVPEVLLGVYTPEDPTDEDFNSEKEQGVKNRFAMLENKPVEESEMITDDMVKDPVYEEIHS
jgi:hypothetical protein